VELNYLVSLDIDTTSIEAIIIIDRNRKTM